MAGNRYRCSVCEAVAWLPGPSLCVDASCPGQMLPAPKKAVLVPIPCAVCAKTFTPKQGRQICCSDECSHVHRKARQARETRKRYALRKKGVAPTLAGSWSWLEPCFAEDGFHHEGKRTLLKSDDYPWHDVLSGNMPSVMDSCQF